MSVITGESKGLNILWQLLPDLPSHEQRKVLYAIIRLVSKKLPSKESDLQYVGGLAALIEYLIADKDNLQENLVDWLTDVSGENTGSDLNTRRGLLAALSSRLSQ